jgi:hypothetical protein
MTSRGKAIQNKNGGYLGRGTILEVVDTRTEDVEVPEWGGTVRIRELTAKEREEFEGEVTKVYRHQQVGAKSADGFNIELYAHKMKVSVVRMGVIDANGKNLFTKADEPVLGRKSARSINLLYSRISKLSKLDEEEEAIAEASDFSEETPEGVSSSESPSTEAAAASES